MAITKRTETNHLDKFAMSPFRRCLGRLRSVCAPIGLLSWWWVEFVDADNLGFLSGDDVDVKRGLDSSLDWYTWCCSDPGCSFGVWNLSNSISSGLRYSHLSWSMGRSMVIVKVQRVYKEEYGDVLYVFKISTVCLFNGGRVLAQSVVHVKLK